MDQGANLGGFAMFIGGGVAGCGLAIAQWIAGGNNFVGACQLPSRLYQLTLNTVYIRLTQPHTVYIRLDYSI